MLEEQVREQSSLRRQEEEVLQDSNEARPYMNIEARKVEPLGNVFDLPQNDMEANEEPALEEGRAKSRYVGARELVPLTRVEKLDEIESLREIKSMQGIENLKNVASIRPLEEVLPIQSMREILSMRELTPEQAAKLERWQDERNRQRLMLGRWTDERNMQNNETIRIL